MKKLSFRVSVAFLSTIFIASALAITNASPASSAQKPESFTHADAGVQFTLPAGWKATPDGEVITVSPADDSVQMVFWVPEENSFEAAVKSLDAELGKTIKNVKVTSKGSEDTLNGMPHFGEVGTGDVEGTTIVWSVDVLAAKKPVIILTFAAPQLFEQHAKEFEQLLSSIKKIQ